MARAFDPRVRSRLRALIVAAAVGCLAAGCMRVTPSTATPVENGRIPASALTTVTPQCQIVSEFADQLGALLATAQTDGVGLVPEESSFLPPGVPGPPVIESCYRTYDGQVWWRTYYCSIGKCGNAAVPGTSKHGLGRAVDFQDQLGELTFTSPGYVWLTNNAALFGFTHPESLREGSPNAEAWHWEAR